MRGRIVAAARADVGVSAYMWGGNGEDAAAISNLRAYVSRYETADKKHTKAANIERVMARIAALNAKGITHIPLQDCSGAVIKWHKLGGVSIKDRTAASLYSGSVKKTMGTLSPGDMVFHYNEEAGKISHVGLYVGNGRVVESIGRDEGTIESSLYRRSDGEYYWTHFGFWPTVGAVDGAETTGSGSGDVGETVTSIMGSVRVRDFPKTGKTIFILRKGESLDIEETDADTGWYCVTTPKGPGFITNNSRYVSLEVG